MPCKASGPKEGSEFGFDPTDEMQAMVKRLSNPPERDGDLTQIGKKVKLPRLTPIKRRLLEGHLEIRDSEAEEMAFSHAVFCQCAMPAAKPEPGTIEWKRQQGKATLLIQAGKVQHPKTREWEQLALPYGPKARLLLLHLNSEAIRNQSPVIPVEDSMTAFFRR